MMSLTFGLFTQVSGSGPLGPLVSVWDRSLKQTAGSTSCPWTTILVGFNLPQNSHLRND